MVSSTMVWNRAANGASAAGGVVRHCQPYRAAVQKRRIPSASCGCAAMKRRRTASAGMEPRFLASPNGTPTTKIEHSISIATCGVPCSPRREALFLPLYLPRPWLRQSPGARRRSRSCWVSLGRVVAPTPVRQLLPAGHAVLGKLQPDARVRQRSVPTQDSSTEQHAYGPHDVNPYKPLRSLKKGRNGSAQLGTVEAKRWSGWRLLHLWQRTHRVSGRGGAVSMGRRRPSRSPGPCAAHTCSLLSPRACHCACHPQRRSRVGSFAERRLGCPHAIGRRKAGWRRSRPLSDC